MTLVERDQLYTWLKAHPTAWSGWPTAMALELPEVLDRWARLERHGAEMPERRMFSSVQAQAEFVREADACIAFLRAETRGDYCRRVHDGV